MRTHRIGHAKIICAMALFCGAERSFGDLIVMDDPRFGASSIVEDTSTGLDWLNLQKTAGLSFDTVSSDLTPGGTFGNWRYANLDEIGMFFADADIPDVDKFTSANSAPVRALLEKIGALHVGDPCFCIFSYALNAETLTPGTHERSELAAYLVSSPSGGALLANIQQDDNLSDLLTGSFLIRDTPAPAPEPAPSELLLAGAVVMLCFSRACRLSPALKAQMLRRTATCGPNRLRSFQFTL